MPTARLQLFNVSTPTPEGAALHGQAAAEGLVTAGVDFHRGFDASTTLDLEARVSAEITQMLRASLGGGVSVRGAGQIQVGIPLDLFSERGGGLLARLRLQLEAAAFLRAEVGMTGEAFAEELGQRVPPPLDTLLEIFLSEVEFDAGVWAHAGVTAQLVGECVLTGQLLPPKESGFTFEFQLGAGWYFGYGVNFIGNLTFSDARRLLSRLAEETTTLILGAVEEHAATLPPAQQSPLNSALPYLRIVLPVATRTLFQVGAELVTAPSGRQGTAGARAAAFAIFSQAQQTALQGIVDAALGQLRALIGGPDLVGQMLSMDAATLDGVAADLRDLRDAVGRLTRFTPTQPGEWAAALVDSLKPIHGLLGRGALPGDVEHVIGAIWAAGQLLARAVGWLDGGNSTPADLTGSEAVGATADDLTAVWVADRVGRQSPDALLLSDLASLLTSGLGGVLGRDPLDWVREAEPSVAAALDWVGDLLGCDPAHLLVEVLTGLGARTDVELAALLEKVTDAFATVVDQYVLPDLIGPVRDNASEPVREFLDGVVSPILKALPRVILPRLAKLIGASDDDATARLAEAVSGLLLQQVQHISVHGIDILLNEALTKGAPLLLGAADDISALGRENPEYAAIAASAAALAFGIDLLPGDVADLLRLSSRAMTLWNEKQRHQLLEAASLVVSLDLHAGGLEDVTRILDESSAPPSMQRLEQMLGEVTDGALLLLTDRDLVQGALLMPVNHALHQIETIGAILAPAFNAAVQVVADALVAAGKVADRIAKLAADLPGYAAQISAEIGGFAVRTHQLVDQVVAAVQDAGLGPLDLAVDIALDLLLIPIPISFRDEVHKQARMMYNNMFADVKSLLDAPLEVLEKVAGWATVALEAQARYGATSQQELSDTVRNAIYRAEAADLTFVLTVPVPPFAPLRLASFTVPGTDVLRLIANTLLQDATVQQHLESAVTTTGKQIRDQGEHNTLIKVRDKGWDQVTMDKAKQFVTTKPPLTLRLIEPADQSFHRGPATVSVHIDGARLIDLDEDPVLMVPRRVRVTVNDKDLVLPSAWHVDASGATLSFYLRVPRSEIPSRDPNSWTEQAAVDPANPFWFRRPPTVIGRAGTNTISVFAVETATPVAPVVVQCTLNPPTRTDLLLYDATSGTGKMVSVAQELTVDVTTADSARDWTAIVAGAFGAADTAFYAEATGRLSWCDVGRDGMIRSLGASTVVTGATLVTVGDFSGEARDELLLYDPAAGTAEVVATDGNGAVASSSHHTELGRGWTALARVPLAGVGYDHLITYRSTDGAIQEWKVDGPAGKEVFVPVVVAFTPGPGWAALTPGYFDGSGNPGLYATSLQEAQFWVRHPVDGWQTPGGPSQSGTGIVRKLFATGDFTHEGAGDQVLAYLITDGSAGLPSNLISVCLPRPDGGLDLMPGTHADPWPGPLLTHVLSGRFA